MGILGKILFYTIWALGWYLGKMPRVVQYIHADLLYIVLYKIGRYRVKVTRTNLINSFPDKTKKELKIIERRFYLHLMDLFVETIMIIGLTEKQMNKRMVFKNRELFDSYCDKGNVIAAMAHYGSWEYPIFYATKTSNLLMPVYHVLQSKWADKLFYDIRTKYGAKPVSMQMVGRKIIQHKNDRIVLALIADQTPPWNEPSPWLMFLHQYTKFYQGIEILSLKYNTPVFFFKCNKIRRGYYEGEFELIYDGVEKVEPYVVTQRYVDKLEHTIIDRPELWMWSHKRWKHQKR